MESKQAVIFMNTKFKIIGMKKWWLISDAARNVDDRFGVRTESWSDSMVGDVAETAKAATATTAATATDGGHASRSRSSLPNTRSYAWWRAYQNDLTWLVLHCLFHILRIKVQFLSLSLSLSLSLKFPFNLWGYIFTFMAVFLLQLFIIFFNRSPRILLQP